MRKVEMWEANDGTLFKNEQDAITYNNVREMRNSICHVMKYDEVYQDLTHTEIEDTIDFIIRQRILIMRILGGEQNA